MSSSDLQQVIYTYLLLLTKQYKLALVKGGDSLKLGR